MTGSYLRLDDFDDFIEVAQGCQNIFYQINDLTEGWELIAYAGRVYWKDEFKSDEMFDAHRAILKDMRGKLVVETSDQVFR
jgi:hypothetical protein